MLGLPLGAALQLLCAGGLLLALAVLWAVSGGGGASGCGKRRALLAAGMGGLWLALLSLRNVGQGFLSGAW